ncbi:hypothetical protein BH23ACT10_BH23ACT10_25030 [soil metagenome]
MIVLAHFGPTHLGAYLALAALAMAIAGRFALHSASVRTDRWLLLAFAGGLGFQVLHGAEHLLQLGYWFARPTAAPWLTPWAAFGRDLLATTTDGQPTTGAELLHLIGNAVFLAALVAGALAVRRMPHTRGIGPWLRRTLWLQGYHVVEHVSLTATWLLVGAPIGASTLFGALTPGTVAGGTTRVWIHFVINAVATWWAILAWRDVRAAGRRGLESDPPRTTVEVTHSRGQYQTAR